VKKETVTDIDFIKWMCEKADGFEIGECTEDWGQFLKAPDGIFLSIKMYQGYFDNIVYPLLLQRAIEGVNSGSIWDTFEIKQHFASMEIRSPSGLCERVIVNNGDYDEAKESALKYIYEQETK
jgi:hypothetical protein